MAILSGESDDLQFRWYHGENRPILFRLGRFLLLKMILK